MKNLIICDTHCDTASEALDNGYELYNNPLMLDFKRMNKYMSYTQYFAAFTAPEYYDIAYERCSSIIKFIINQTNKYSNYVKLCKNYQDIKDAINEQKLSAFISVEGGEGVKSLEDVEKLYDMGARMITLTWNNDNHLGGGALGDGRGLTEFGKQVVKKMNKLGIIVDVSHSSEKTFYDILNITEKPIAASHSNSYRICQHPRNLKDEQIKEIVKNDGVIGINFYTKFLKNDGLGNIDDIIKHIEYFLSLGCENSICIGSDFDGIDTLPKGIEDVCDTYNIFKAMSSIGYNDSIIQKIAYKNIYRLISICL